MDLARMALELPDSFDSMWWYALHPGGQPDWQQEGETMQEARERLKAERAAAAARYG